jgi:DNA-binding response OmpR family regulator
MTLRTVLVVTAEAPLRASLEAAIAARGHKTLTAATYGEGRRLLIDWQPDVLVTTVRLQEHNGLHLAIVSRMSSVLTKTIVIGYGDRVLEADARQAGALYLTNPDLEEIVTAVDNAIHRRERRWPRVRADLSARAADQYVRLVDLSYGGFRIELPVGSDIPTADGFDLTVGDLRVSALPVWMKQNGSERVWCGATVADSGEHNMAWRDFVDETLGQHSIGH